MAKTTPKKCATTFVFKLIAVEIGVAHSGHEHLVAATWFALAGSHHCLSPFLRVKLPAETSLMKSGEKNVGKELYQRLRTLSWEQLWSDEAPRFNKASP